jgi:hypothetical protein
LDVADDLTPPPVRDAPEDRELAVEPRFGNAGFVRDAVAAEEVFGREEAVGFAADDFSGAEEAVTRALVARAFMLCSRFVRLEFGSFLPTSTTLVSVWTEVLNRCDGSSNPSCSSKSLAIALKVAALTVSFIRSPCPLSFSHL